MHDPFSSVVAGRRVVRHIAKGREKPLKTDRQNPNASRQSPSKFRYVLSVIDVVLARTRPLETTGFPEAAKASAPNIDVRYVVSPGVMGERVQRPMVIEAGLPDRATTGLTCGRLLRASVTGLVRTMPTSSSRPQARVLSVATVSGAVTVSSICHSKPKAPSGLAGHVLRIAIT